MNGIIKLNIVNCLQKHSEFLIFKIKTFSLSFYNLILYSILSNFEEKDKIKLEVYYM